VDVAGAARRQILIRMDALDGNAIAGLAVRTLRLGDDHRDRALQALRNALADRRARGPHTGTWCRRALLHVRQRRDGARERPRLDGAPVSRSNNRVPRRGSQRRAWSASALGPGCRADPKRR
jgi:hypothetical protein